MRSTALFVTHMPCGVNVSGGGANVESFRSAPVPSPRLLVAASRLAPSSSLALHAPPVCVLRVKGEGVGGGFAGVVGSEGVHSAAERRAGAGGANATAALHTAHGGGRQEIRAA